MDDDQVEDAQVIGEQPQGAPDANLTMQDIATFVQIIDVASRRGAFEGRELAGVGILRNKTEEFLRQQGAAGQRGSMPPEAAPADVPEGPMSDKVVQ
jgi:hypothetical protein